MGILKLIKGGKKNDKAIGIKELLAIAQQNYMAIKKLEARVDKLLKGKNDN
jgi:hypothetical protein